MEKYRRQYPDADIALFEPDRENADMFFANIFSYSQRKRLCEAAFISTRQSLLTRQAELAPMLARRGIRLDLSRLDDAKRTLSSALEDPRPLHSRPMATAPKDLKAKFEAATAAAKQTKKKPDNATLLKLYSYYKQATEGDVTGSRPGGFDFVGGAKFDAWSKLKGTSKDEAMQNYIKQVEKLNRD